MTRVTVSSIPQPDQTEQTDPHPSFFQRRLVEPILELLRVGCSPRKLAWSLAVGLVIGINPLLGSTTLVCLVIALILRLNLVASQIANHLVYPLQIALFLVFIKIGDVFFHTGRLPLEGHALFHAVRHHPWATTRLLWTWEWHALIVWVLFSAVAVPTLVAILTPALTRLLHRLHKDQLPA
jgi:uncharacterized protein (DUF2062 family)